MNLNNLTPEQRAELKAEFIAQETAEKLAYSNAIDTYKQIVSDTVEENFPRLTDLASALTAAKSVVRDSFSAVIEMKQELYGVKEGQQSHTFINEDGTRRIRIGYNMNDNYDDTVESGVAIVKEYVQSLASNEQSQQLVDMILDLLAKDSKGTLKASKVLKLRKYADKSGNARFIEGVKIIMDAYKPIESKSYIKAEYKDALGMWVAVPNGLTAS